MRERQTIRSLEDHQAKGNRENTSALLDMARKQPIISELLER